MATSSRGPGRARYRAVAAAVVVVVLLVVGALLLERSADSAGSAAGSTADRSAVGPATTSSPSAPATTSPAAAVIHLPEAGSTVVFFGDSYAASYTLDDPAQGFPALVAAAFGWQADTQALGGTGYIAGGDVQRPYLDRVRALPPTDSPLVLVEGGINDASAGATEEDERAAAVAVVQGLRVVAPRAQIVLLGPAEVPAVDPAAVARVDRGLAVAARDTGAWYLSPATDGWPVGAHVQPDGLHPDAAGHAVLADELVAHLRALSARPSPSGAPATTSR